MRALTGGDALVQTLLAHGVTQGFGVPGESYLAVLEGLRRERARFRLVALVHVKTDLRDISTAGPLSA